MAVIVLEGGVIGVVVGVECLAVFCAFHAAYFVVLDECVVAAPGPDSCGVVVAAGSAAADGVVLDEAAVTAPWFYAVAAAVFDEVVSYYDIEAGVPVLRAADEWCFHADAVAVGAEEAAVFYDQAVESRLFPAFALCEDAAAFG